MQSSLSEPKSAPLVTAFFQCITGTGETMNTALALCTTALFNQSLKRFICALPRILCGSLASIS
ncbi:hypothetical protein D3C84_1167750 [compost metagenome]